MNYSIGWPYHNGKPTISSRHGDEGHDLIYEWLVITRSKVYQEAFQLGRSKPDRPYTMPYHVLRLPFAHNTCQSRDCYKGRGKHDDTASFKAGYPSSSAIAHSCVACKLDAFYGTSEKELWSVLWGILIVID